MIINNIYCIIRTSLPDFEHYKASEFKNLENATNETDLGPHVVHIYNIRNNGPSTIEEAVVFIHYPYQTQGDDVLMYLLNQPETDGNIQCDPHINVNPLNLALDQSLSRKSYLETIGAVVRTGSSSSQVHIEQSSSKSSSSATATTIGRGTRIFTEEEKRRLKEEDSLESTGDASYIHTQRANAAATSSGLTGERQDFTSTSWNSTSWNSTFSGNRGSPSIVVTTRNRTVSYGPDGKPYVVESSTEYVHSLDRPQYVSSHSSAAYQQGSGDRRGSGGSSVYHANIAGSSSANSNSNANSQWQSQSKGSSGQNVDANSHQNLESTRGHVQMAASFGGAAPNNYRPQTQTNYGVRGSGFHTEQAAYNRGNQGGFSELHSGSGIEKIAQGGRGFQTGSLDLGQLNRGNADDDLRQRTSSAHYIARGGGSSIGAEAGSKSYSNSGGKPYYGTNGENEDENYYYDQDETSNTANSHHEYSSSSSSSGSRRGSTYEQRRFRRQTNSETPIEIPNVDLSSPCKTTKCATLRCVAKNLGNNEGVWVAMRARLVAKTLEKLASNVPLNISTMAISHVTKLPYIGEPKDDIIRSHEIFYKAIPEPIPIPDVVPMWVVVLAACVGAIILLLLVFLLYKVSTYKYKKSDFISSQEMLVCL